MNLPPELLEMLADPKTRITGMVYTPGASVLDVIAEAVQEEGLEK